MKRWIILVATVAAFLFMAVPQVAFCAPRISIQNSEYDAGEIPQGKEISNEFVLKNIGTDPLTIKVRPCWGVDVSVPGGQTIAPGDSRKVIVKMSTYSYTTDLFKEIKLETNDTKNNLVVLTMRAKVFETLKAIPRLMNFGRMKQNQTAEKELTFENVSKKPVKITKLNSSNPTLISISPTEPFVLKAGESKKLAVKISTGKLIGFVGGDIELSTDLPYLTKKSVHVRAEVMEK